MSSGTRRRSKIGPHAGTPLGKGWTKLWGRGRTLEKCISQGRKAPRAEANVKGKSEQSGGGHNLSSDPHEGSVLIGREATRQGNVTSIKSPFTEKRYRKRGKG